MELLEQLGRTINQNLTSLPADLKLGYVDPDHGKPFSMYANPGSRVISSDFDGTQVKELPFEVALATNQLSQGDGVMWKISTYLDNLTHLDTDGTYTVEKIEIQPQPFLSMIDEKGRGMFLLDFTVQIATKRKQGDLN